MAWHVFKQNKAAVVALLFIVAVVLFCYVGPWFYHSNQTDASAGLFFTNLPPQRGFPLGTDSQGYDILGRIMFGGQTSLEVGLLSALVAMTWGAIYGLVSGYRGGAIDAVLMRIVDALLSIPGLFLLLALMAVFSRSELLLVLVLGLTGWYGVARLTRSEALALRNREYVSAVRSMGGGSTRIIRRHILPNSVSTLITVTTFTIGDSILALSALGFLQLGVPLPKTDWGTMLNTGIQSIQLNQWWQVYPVAFVFLVLVISFNYVGDALRDVFEVRLRTQ
ncbi:MAG: ABC transporter permease [Actinobacteria bacterium]|nr:ABC transporter permease [Actinomycetota bacterium]